MLKDEEYKTRITVHCKNKRKRIITVQGRWTVSMAASLGRDLEGDDYRYVTLEY